MLNPIRECFRRGRLYYSGHARVEMELEEFGEIKEDEVTEAVMSGNIIENYANDEPYPSCLIYGRTSLNRPLHTVCAFSAEEDLAIVITAYEPDPTKWIDFSRRRK
jgi:hypothetical protein